MLTGEQSIVADIKKTLDLERCGLAEKKVGVQKSFQLKQWFE
jgi:hypothetical protein